VKVFYSLHPEIVPIELSTPSLHFTFLIDGVPLTVHLGAHLFLPGLQLKVYLSAETPKWVKRSTPQNEELGSCDGGFGLSPFTSEILQQATRLPAPPE